MQLRTVVLRDPLVDVPRDPVPYTQSGCGATSSLSNKPNQLVMLQVLCVGKKEK